ncbi:hypothetical protein B0H14DRAFT_3130403 [Mycena olivaceomarginata]|nr:hypothetical protein B0H14DRAFT_3130403 [Mycena olivaceomarginata]
MCNAAVTSMMLGALPLLPGSRYITLGLLSAALVIYTVNQQRPSHKLGRVERAIETCEETLKAKLSASKIETQLLETHSVTTWEELVEYLQNLRDIVQNINQCAQDVKEIQRSTLVGIVYVGFTVGDTNERFPAHNRGRTPTPIFEGIKELREIHDTVVSASTSAWILGFPTYLMSLRSYSDGKPSLWIGSYIHTGSVFSVFLYLLSGFARLKSRWEEYVELLLNPWRLHLDAPDVCFTPGLASLLREVATTVSGESPAKYLGHDLPVEAAELVLTNGVWPIHRSNPTHTQPKPTLTTPPRRHIHPPTNVKARTLAILHRCLVPRVADRWTVERVDEAAWCVSGAEASPCDSCNDSGDDEQLEIAGAAHAAKHRPRSSPREGGSLRWICRCEKGGALVVARARTRSSTISTTGDDARIARPRPCARRRRIVWRASILIPTRSRPAGAGVEVQGEGGARVAAGVGIEVGVLARSRPRPRPRRASLLRRGLAGFRAIGLGFPAGKGKGAEAGKVLGADDGGPSEEGEGEALGAGLLFSPQNQTACERDNDSGIGLGAAAGERRAGSTPPGAWHGVAGAAGAGRSRSLGGSELGSA